MLASSLCPPSCCPPGISSQPSSSHPSSAEDKARGSPPSLTCLIDHCFRAVCFPRQLLSWIPGTSTGITGQMGTLALPRWRVTKKNYYSEFVTKVPDCMCCWPNYVNCPEYFIFRNKRGRSVHAACSHLVGLSFPPSFQHFAQLEFQQSISVWRCIIGQDTSNRVKSYVYQNEKVSMSFETHAFVRDNQPLHKSCRLAKLRSEAFSAF